MRSRKMVSCALILALAAMLGNSTLLYAEHKERSVKKSAVIIGGSTAAGAILGGIMGGKKGAGAGAVAAGGGAAVYDIATRDRDHRVRRNDKDKAIIIGGSSATGAAAGGIAAGKKGALIGALIGAAGGYVLEKKTNNRDRRIF